MSTVAAATALSTLLSIGGLWLLVSYLFPDLLIDRFRQRLFDIRGRLFEYAADGHVDFDHLAYCRLRSQLNSYIRFAHRLDAIQLFFISLFLNRELQEQVGVPHPVDEWEGAVAGLADDVRASLEGFHREMHEALLAHFTWNLLLLTPVLIPIMPVVGLWVVGRNLVRRTVSSVRDAVSPLLDFKERFTARTDAIIGTYDALEVAA